MARMPAEEDEATQSANAPESDGSLLVVATTADNSRLYIYRHTDTHVSAYGYRYIHSRYYDKGKN